MAVRRTMALNRFLQMFGVQSRYASGSQNGDGPSTRTGTDGSVNLSQEQWKEKLTPEQYSICREKGTEMPHTGKLLHNHDRGIYNCVCCGAELFSSETKYDSGSGWPSFTATYRPNGEAENPSNVNEHVDLSLGMRRVEVTCKKCDSHLGHVFNDGPAPTGERYCINSVSLAFTPKSKS